MARRQRSTVHHSSADDPHRSVHPSSPTRPPTHVLYITFGNNFAVHSWCAAYPAAIIFNELIGEQPYKWVNRTTVQTNHGLQIKSDQLEEIVELTPTQLGYELTSAEVNTVNSIFSPRSDTDPHVHHTSNPKPADYITINQLAEELNMRPSKCRAILRDRNEPKPVHGWAWDSTNAERIRGLFK